MSRHPRVFIAIDSTDQGALRAMCDLASHHGTGVKIGMEAFYGMGVETVRAAVRDVPLFLDLKLHDIPNTVSKGMASLVSAVAPQLFTVHASGGRSMLQAAAKQQQDAPVLDVAGVTVLTSLGQQDLSIFGAQTAQEKVVSMAELVVDSGCRALVCSGQEVAAVKAACPTLWTVVPGIRLAGDSADDQQRVITPARAIASGADSLVIGRSITGAADAETAMVRVMTEIDAAERVA